MKKLALKFKKLPDKTGYLLILPFFIIFTYFVLIPIGQLLIDSFMNYKLGGAKTFTGLGNYFKLFRDVSFTAAISNTFVYTLGSIFAKMILGFLIALLVNSTLIKSGVARTFLFLPYVLSMVAVSMVWLLIYDVNFGYANSLLGAIGLPPVKWLQSTDTAMLSIIIMSVWKDIGYFMIINLAGLQNISGELYEAAELDGANKFRCMLHITIPSLSPTTFFLFVTGVINSFNAFEQVIIMTAGGPSDSTTTIVHQIYKNAFQFFNMGYASAESIVLLLFVVAITALTFKFSGRGSDTL